MKVALYIADGIEQVVLTPETPLERSVLAKIEAADRSFKILKGSFYECRGGWVRTGTGDESTILVLRPKAPAPAPAGGDHEGPFSGGQEDQG